MNGMLKKLAMFAPGPTDTVGNLGAGEAAPPRAAVAAPIEVVDEPVAERVERERPAPVRERGRAREPEWPRKPTGTDQALLRTKGGGIDARSLRRTGRTANITLKLRPELVEEMKGMVAEEGITLGALMDEMWSAFLQKRVQRRRTAVAD